MRYRNANDYFIDCTMAKNTALFQSRRKPSPEEINAIPWLRKLKPEDRSVAEMALEVGQAMTGDYICREGKPVRYWLGLVDGFLKVSNTRTDGRAVTYMGVPSGSWFGEGTALKLESYRYSVQALRRSTVAVLPLEQFHWLLDHSIEFNRIIIQQLSERVGLGFAGRETDRIPDPDIRVARTIIALFNPVLAPGVGEFLRVTQQELAAVVGLSRQRVNEALVRLSGKGLIETVYGGLRVTDMQGLCAL